MTITKKEKEKASPDAFFLRVLDDLQLIKYE
jgi:hypothetical protein